MAFGKDWAGIATIMDDVAITTRKVSSEIDLVTDGYDGTLITIGPAFPASPTDRLVVEIHTDLGGVGFSGVPKHKITIDNANTVQGTADATEANKLHDADGGFTEDVVGKVVKNLTDDTFAIITAFVDSGELTLDTDIFVDTEAYSIVDIIEFEVTNVAEARVVVYRDGSTDTIDTTIKHRRWRQKTI